MSRGYITGGKAVSSVLAEGFCPYYPKIKDSPPYKKAREHNTILNRLVKYFENLGYNCTKEYNIECSPQRNSPIYGRIDILCSKPLRNEIVVIEVKSYGLDKLSAQELYQLSLYLECLREKSKNASIVGYLYMGGRSKVLLKINDNDQSFNALSYLSPRRDEIYPGYWCRSCRNTQCIFSPWYGADE